MIRIVQFSGEDARQHAHTMAMLRIEVFREYPYLYHGSIESELVSLQRYFHSSSFVLFLVLDNGQPVGLCTCLPLKDESHAIRQPFIDQKINVNKYLYIGESLLLVQYRGQGIGKELFRLCDSVGQSIQGIEFTCFCTVQRENDHPAKPGNYKMHDGIWEKCGFVKHDNLSAFLSWREINMPIESTKKMIFWIKQLPPKK